MKHTILLGILSIVGTTFSGEKLQITNSSERAVSVLYEHEKRTKEKPLYSYVMRLSSYAIQPGQTRRMPGTRTNPTEIVLEKNGKDAYPEIIKIGDCKHIIIAESEQGTMFFYRKEGLEKIAEIKL